jgi:hypothetical protein
MPARSILEAGGAKAAREDYLVAPCSSERLRA